MLHVNGKFAEAEFNYGQALRLAPDDPATLTNVRRLRRAVAGAAAAAAAAANAAGADADGRRRDPNGTSG